MTTAQEQCGLTLALSVMAGKWKPIILWQLNESPRMRYSELRRELVGISEKVLAQQLRELVRDGLIDRRVRGASPPYVVDYANTEFGRSLNAALEPLGWWGHDNQDLLVPRSQGSSAAAGTATT